MFVMTPEFKEFLQEMKELIELSKKPKTIAALIWFCILFFNMFMLILIVKG